MNYLKLRMNDLRKIPMFMHLQEVRIPERTNSNRVSVIKAEIPSFFLHAIKKLRLVHK
jgi:hypothetical protein